jgi:hypothetical protein
MPIPGFNLRHTPSIRKDPQEWEMLVNGDFSVRRSLVPFHLTTLLLSAKCQQFGKVLYKMILLVGTPVA